MSKSVTLIGPADHGRRMSLDEFNRAEGREGYLYELSRGIITVTDVPGKRHLDQLDTVRQQLYVSPAMERGEIYRIGGGMHVKMLICAFESERHPDVAVYKYPPDDEDELWATWVPDLVIEVVSPNSVRRDYVENREEYLWFGVREYWIIDADRGEDGEMLILRRVGGRWVERVVRPPEVYQPRLLPGLVFDVAAVSRAARGGG